MRQPEHLPLPTSPIMASAQPPAKRRRTSGSKEPASPSLRKTTKSLHNFFQPATEEQRWSSHKFDPRPSDPVKDTVDDEIIEDDYDSYDELFTEHFSGWTTRGAKPPQAPRSPPRRSSSRTSDSSRKPTFSKSFLTPSTAQRHLPEVKLEDDRPWAQRFSPSNLEELAVHKKKVSDVRSWLEAAFTGRNKCVCAQLRPFLVPVLTATRLCLADRSRGYSSSVVRLAAGKQRPSPSFPSLWGLISSSGGTRRPPTLLNGDILRWAPSSTSF